MWNGKKALIALRFCQSDTIYLWRLTETDYNTRFIVLKGWNCAFLRVWPGGGSLGSLFSQYNKGIIRTRPACFICWNRLLSVRWVLARRISPSRYMPLAIMELFLLCRTSKLRTPKCQMKKLKNLFGNVGGL